MFCPLLKSYITYCLFNTDQKLIDIDCLSQSFKVCRSTERWNLHTLDWSGNGIVCQIPSDRRSSFLHWNVAQAITNISPEFCGHPRLVFVDNYSLFPWKVRPFYVHLPLQSLRKQVKHIRQKHKRSNAKIRAPRYRNQTRVIPVHLHVMGVDTTQSVLQPPLFSHPKLRPPWGW